MKFEVTKNNMATQEYFDELKQLAPMGIPSFLEVEMDFIKQTPQAIEKDPYFTPLKDFDLKNTSWDPVERKMEEMISGHFLVNFSKIPDPVKEKMKHAQTITVKAISDSGEVLGYTSFITTADFPKNHYRISALAVDKKARRKGLAEKLIEKGQKEISDIQKLFLSTRPTNDVAKSFYKKIGFSVDPQAPQVLGHHYHPEHWVHMMKNLP